MKEIEIFDITIKDYSLTEQVTLLKGYLRNQAVNTVAYLSTQMLLSIRDDELEKEYVKNLDLVILADALRHDEDGDIVTRGIDGKGDDFLENAIRQAATTEGVYLISDNEENLEALKKSLLFINDRIKYCGEAIVTGTDRDTMYNEINCLLPKFVFMSTPWKLQGEIMKEARRFLTVPIVLGIQPSMVQNINNGHKLGKTTLRDRIQFRRKRH